MVPSAFVHLEKFPLTPNANSIARRCPGQAKRPLLAQDFIAPRTTVEKQLALSGASCCSWKKLASTTASSIWAAIRWPRFAWSASFRLAYGREIPAVKVFQHPTIAKLAEFLEKTREQVRFFLKLQSREPARHNSGLRRMGRSARDAIAVVGMSGRFPGASNPDQLWRNLCNSVESISFFTPEELGPGIDEQSAQRSKLHSRSRLDRGRGSVRCLLLWHRPA
jgi:hypothetical protein